MKLEHKSLGVSVEVLDDILQRHTEDYFKALRELGGPDYLDQATPQRMGNFVRAGCRSGILNTIHEEDVDGMKPAAVAWIAGKIDKHLAEAFEIPPE